MENSIEYRNGVNDGTFGDDRPTAEQKNKWIRFQADSKLETLAARHTTYFQVALSRWRERNPAFNDTPFSQFPSKYASDVLAAAHVLQVVAEDCHEDQMEMERRLR